MVLEDKGKPVDDVEHDEQEGEGLQEELVNPENKNKRILILVKIE